MRRCFVFAGRNFKELVRDRLNLIFGLGFPLVLLLLLTAIQRNVPVQLFELDQLTPGIAVFGLIIPIMNVLLSAILNGEPLFEWQYLAALVLVCGGIYLVNRPNGKLGVRK